MLYVMDTAINNVDQYTAAPTGETVESKSHSGTPQVLIVEDDSQLRELLVLTLSRNGYQCCQAESIRSAQARLVSCRPALILLDWLLPDNCGMSYLYELRQEYHPRDLPIIMLSAHANEEDRIAGLHGGADDYLVKPFSPRELIARINAVLRRREWMQRAEASDRRWLVV